MKEHSRLATRALGRAVHLAAATLAIAGLGAVSGCLTRPIAPIEPLTTSTVVERLTQSGVNKIDLLLVVDNSASMADKQAILALAIPDLVDGLVNPACLDVNGVPITTGQPTSPLDACPGTSTREFTPIVDIHIGLVSSSLGTFGANGCPETPPASCTGTPSTIANDDHGQLVTRTNPCATTSVPTYQSEGFLAWDPKGADSPPGESAIGDPTTTPPTPGLLTSLTNIVVGDGQLGCGFESQNESWYRFLIDPTPYGSISLNASNNVVTSGVDTALLTQRKEFLRPDSLLAIINVTDETDTSIKEYSSYPLFAEPSLHLPHARTECTTKGPKDPCCASCGQNAPAGCPADAACASNTYYTAADENTSLRAFGLISHKQRYGIEFFYPPSRYVTALTAPTVTNNIGTAVPNPIYSILDPTNDSSTVRDPGLVFYAAIVGVPWQLIARQTAAGVPDLINGVSALDKTQIGGFKTSAELDLMDKTGTHSFWDDIAGDPENYVLAASPFMVESTTPRTGTDPVTGAMLSPPSTPNGSGAMVGGSPINDHEWNIPTPAGDIEYACVFPILAPINCADPSVTACDCRIDAANPTADNPLCSPNPADNMNLTLQTKAKAYPGIKHLAIAHGMGTQGIAASICAKQISDNTTADFGYRPAVKAIVDRLKQALHGQCLPRTLQPNAQGYESACVILEATKVADSAVGTCNACAGTARTPVTVNAIVEAAKADPLYATAQWNCFCEITEPNPDTPAGLAELNQCLTQPTTTLSDGWCYVDPSTASMANLPGETAVVAKCPADQQQEIRFVGAGKPASGATLFITCAGT